MKMIKKFFRFIIIVLLISALFLVYMGKEKYKNALAELPLDASIQKLQSKNLYTEIENVPQIFTDAIVSVEDRRFYEHNGIDIKGTVRAVVNDLRSISLSEGGSSITQQLAKNMYFMGDDTPTRKIAEMFMALKIEQEYSKKEILEFYFNIIYFGSNHYGIGEAAKGYYNKLPEQLSNYECTLLAGLPNAPSAYSPDKNKALAQKRQLKVIRAMLDCGRISDEDAEKILAEINN